MGQSGLPCCMLTYALWTHRKLNNLCRVGLMRLRARANVCREEEEGRNGANS